MMDGAVSATDTNQHMTNAQLAAAVNASSHMVYTLYSFIFLTVGAVAFHYLFPPLPLHHSHLLSRELIRLVVHRPASDCNGNGNATPVAVAIKASDLNNSLGMSPKERAVMNIHRVCGPSIWDALARNAMDRLVPLGRGDTTHVDIVKVFVNNTVGAIYGHNFKVNDVTSAGRVLPAQLFVRFGGLGDVNSWIVSYHPCEIIDIIKEMDIALLRMTCPLQSSLPPLPLLRALSYGSLLNLLVGKSLLAIGNPFGLDRTITSGLVSALGRFVAGQLDIGS